MVAGLEVSAEGRLLSPFRSHHCRTYYRQSGSLSKASKRGFADLALSVPCLWHVYPSDLKSSCCVSSDRMRSLTLWPRRAVVHTLSMTAIQSSSPQSFEELSTEAQTLLFIYASAAWARYHANIPNPTKLLKEVGDVWCTHKLSADAISDPDRMTFLLEKHFEYLPPERARRPSTADKTCHSRESR